MFEAQFSISPAMSARMGHILIMQQTFQSPALTPQPMSGIPSGAEPYLANRAKSGTSYGQGK